jgi:hypothetical protein
MASPRQPMSGNHFIAACSSGYEGAGDMTLRRKDAVEGSRALATAIQALLRRRGGQ